MEKKKERKKRIPFSNSPDVSARVHSRLKISRGHPRYSRFLDKPKQLVCLAADVYVRISSESFARTFRRRRRRRRRGDRSLLRIFSDDLFSRHCEFARVHGRMLFAFRSCRLEILRRYAGRTHTDKLKKKSERERESVCVFVGVCVCVSVRVREKENRKEYEYETALLSR